ncbi:MAG: polysaccharide deacetylase family protein [Clostridia bacterium]|nr:polysaccharide deacetylase family protein [Clostridia bacterium]
MMKCLCALLSLFCCVTCGAPAKTQKDVRRVPVVMYHSVCKTNVGEFVISPDGLRRDFKYFRDKGYTAVFVRDIVAFCDGKKNLPEKPIVITFDDGFYNNAYYALGIAEEFGMKITVSVVGSYVKKEEKEKKRSPVYSYLNYDDMRRMQQSGWVEFCNHTYDMHRTSPRKGVRRAKGESASEYEKTLTADSEKCRKLIKSACGVSPDVFTYPFGCYSNETGKILAKLGYRAVMTCKGGINVFSKGSAAGLDCIMRYNRPGKADTKAFFAKIGV